MPGQPASNPLFQFRLERLVIEPFALVFIECIGYCTKYRREGRLTQARWVNIVFDKMNLDLFGRFVVPDDAVIMKIALLDCR